MTDGSIPESHDPFPELFSGGLFLKMELLIPDVKEAMMEIAQEKNDTRFMELSEEHRIAIARSYIERIIAQKQAVEQQEKKKKNNVESVASSSN